MEGSSPASEMTHNLTIIGTITDAGAASRQVKEGDKRLVCLLLPRTETKH